MTNESRRMTVDDLFIQVSRALVHNKSQVTIIYWIAHSSGQLNNNNFSALLIGKKMLE
jgi:hypothetical protein